MVLCLRNYPLASGGLFPASRVIKVWFLFNREIDWLPDLNGDTPFSGEDISERYYSLPSSFFGT